MVATPFKEALTFDDVLITPAASDVSPSDVNVSSKVTKNVVLPLPVLSAAMDTVTEYRLAIALAQEGGVGVIHRNMSVQDQAFQVQQVKKFEAGMVVNPLTIEPNETLADVLQIMKKHSISGVPVVEPGTGKLVGIVTNRDVRFATHQQQPVRDLMTYEKLVTVKEGVKSSEAKKLLHTHRIEKLLVVDDAYRCIGLITVKDMEKTQRFPYACKDDQGRLRVAAATSADEDGVRRCEKLLEAEADFVVVDTAHGHATRSIAAVRAIKKHHNHARIIAGNIATADGAKSLIDAGADAIKVGIGPGSICTTRIVTGVGVPQLTALMDVVDVCHKLDVPVIADGGIKFSGDISKALAAGADCVMLGSLLAGTSESPGELYLYQGRSYKSYRGMGSAGAMADGSAERYSQGHIKNAQDYIPEGVEGQVPYKGSLAKVVHQLLGGVRAAMSYTGCASIAEFQKKASFVKISASSVRESHVHSVSITKESPNYPVKES